MPVSVSYNTHPNAHRALRLGSSGTGCHPDHTSSRAAKVSIGTEESASLLDGDVTLGSGLLRGSYAGPNASTSEKNRSRRVSMRRRMRLSWVPSAYTSNVCGIPRVVSSSENARVVDRMWENSSRTP